MLESRLFRDNKDYVLKIKLLYIVFVKVKTWNAPCTGNCTRFRLVKMSLNQSKFYMIDKNEKVLYVTREICMDIESHKLFKTCSKITTKRSTTHLRIRFWRCTLVLCLRYTVGEYSAGFEWESDCTEIVLWKKLIQLPDMTRPYPLGTWSCAQYK